MRTIFMLTLCFIITKAAAQADECAGATVITTTPFGVTCATPTTGTTLTATTSANAPTCAGSSADDDVWYSFVANSASIIIRFTSIRNASTNANEAVGFAVYAGSCPVSAASYTCTGILFAGHRIVAGLTPGSTYYLRLWCPSNGIRINFSFCIQDTPNTPINDDCNNAIAIATQPFGASCNNTVAVNTTGATPSLPDPSCTTTDNNDDVWYSFTANSASVVLRFANAIETTDGSSGSLGYALYSSACPSSVTTLSCALTIGFGNGYRIINGLTPGNTYYLRLFSSDANNYMTFTFCVQDVPAPPINNECANAIAITTQPFGNNYAASISTTTNGATASSPNPSCTSTENNDDIWYSFTASSASVLLRFRDAIETLDGSTGSLGYALYGSSCPATTAVLSCANFIGFGSGHRIIDGLTPGNTYYLRLYGSEFNNYISFSFCVQDIPAAPANNECTNAIAIPTQPFGSNCAASVSALTTGATASSPAISCGSSNNDDIWYSFTAASASVILRFSNGVETVNGGTGSLGYALYSACPSTTTSLGCENFIGFGSGYRIINGLTIGNTYYLRLFSEGVNNYISFDFCIQDVPAPPVNNECANAIALPLVPAGDACYSTSANTTGATGSVNSSSCTLTSGHDNDDIWYSFVATGSTAILRFNNAVLTTTGATASLGYALYNSCPTNSTALACNNFIGFGNGSVQLNGLVPGNSYYLRLYSESANNYASFNFCIQEALVNDECANALALSVSNGFCDTPTLATLAGATASSGFSAPSCLPSGMSVDVWFSVTIPASGNLIVQTSAIIPSASDLVLTAYTGTCGSLTEIACDNDGNPEPAPSANHSRIVLTGRPPGQQIYLRVTPFTTSGLNRFAICAWDETNTVRPAIASAGNCIGGPARTISAANGNTYMWVPLFDNNGDIIAEIYSDGNDLGAVDPSVFINTGTVRNHNGRFYLDRNIALQASLSPVSPVKLRYFIKNSELLALQTVDPAVAGINSLQVLKTSTACQNAYTGGATVLMPTGGTYGTDHYLQAETNSFSSFYFDRSVSVLPLKFISFTGRKTNAGNLIEWSVAMEMDIVSLKLEESSNGNNFITISEKGRDDFISERNGNWTYQHLDATIQPVSYYRVKMEDIHGKSVYSTIIRLADNSRSGISVYPNLSAGFTRIELPGNNPRDGILSLHDTQGRLVQQKVIASYQAFVELDISNVTNGTYFIKAVVNDIAYYSKVIKW